MTKNGILTMAMTGVIGTGTAQAFALPGCAAGSFTAPISVVVAGDLANGLPAEFSMLIWAPVLLITFISAGCLLWLIAADARAGLRKAYSTRGRGWGDPRVRRRLADVHH